VALTDGRDMKSVVVYVGIVDAYLLFPKAFVCDTGMIVKTLTGIGNNAADNSSSTMALIWIYFPVLLRVGYSREYLYSPGIFRVCYFLSPALSEIIS
jgi:hypothetical protein